MLAILLATCERSLEAFQAADNPLDEEFVRDLERVMARTRGELVAFANLSRHHPPSSLPRANGLLVDRRRQRTYGSS